MCIFIKVLSISANPSVEVHDSFGIDHLYPTNTERTVKKLTLRGYKIIKQFCTIEMCCSLDGCIHYNKWYTMPNPN